jgi:hypothetical protein
MTTRKKTKTLKSVSTLQHLINFSLSLDSLPQLHKYQFAAPQQQQQQQQRQKTTKAREK